MMIDVETELINVVHEIGPRLRETSENSDQNKIFVDANYQLLKEYGLVAAIIPKELGGRGVSHSEMCNIIETIAQYCSSTALAFSMHQHLLSTMIWKYQEEGSSGEFLAKVAEKNLILISTGAKDWLESNGELVKYKNGYRLNGFKFFASQSAYGDMVITSARINGSGEEPKVYHFGVPMISDGVSLLDDWDTLGMRGTGSQTIAFNDVFIPESSISLKRPAGEFHPFWNIVLTVALPLIMSTYVGIAKKAFQITRKHLAKQPKLRDYTMNQLGEIHNLLTNAQVVHQDMVSLANDLKFLPTKGLTNKLLVRKTIVANACIETVSQCMKVMGGKAYYKKSGLEVLFRDVQAAQYHPLAEKEQQLFTARYLLNS